MVISLFALNIRLAEFLNTKSFFYQGFCTGTGKMVKQNLKLNTSLRLLIF